MRQSSFAPSQAGPSRPAPAGAPTQGAAPRGPLAASGNLQAQHGARTTAGPLGAGVGPPAGNLQTLQQQGLRRAQGIGPAGGPLERQAEGEAAGFVRLAAPAPASGGTAPSDAGGGRLPGALKTRLEGHFGRDLSGVRVHTDAAAARDAASLQARAVTFGQDISFAAGRYEPGSAPGLRLLAHEVAHAVQHLRGQGQGWLHCDPDPPGVGSPSASTLDDLIRVQPPGFHDRVLDDAYQRYLHTEATAADPATWALRQTTGQPRERLERLLGPDYARGQRTAAARPRVDVSSPSAPQDYDPARQQQDLAALQASGGALTARLGNLGYDPATGLSISAGHGAILQGNVGEILARPLLEQALQEVRQNMPTAQLFLGVTAQLRLSDGTWGSPVQFTDGIIGTIEGGGFLRVLRVAEVKSGAEGGVQGQEQVHRWIEAHSTQGLRILLPGVPRSFEYSEARREVLDLTRAPRLVIVPRDARFAGAGSGHGTTAAVIPMRMAQSAAEIDYLTRASAQRLLLESQARQVMTAIQSRQLTPVTVESTLQLQEAGTIARVQAQSQGYALANGTLYRVGSDAQGRSLQRVPLQPLELAQGPAGPGTPAGGAPVQALPPAATPPQAAPGTAGASGTPGGANVPLLPPPGAPGPATGAPLFVPGLPGSAPVAPGTSIPTNVINLSGQNIVLADGRVVAPSQPVELREGDIVVRGHSARWTAVDARTGEPIAAVFEGGSFYTVKAAGQVVTVGPGGRVSLNRMPQEVPLSSDPAGGAASGGRTFSPAMRGVAAGLGIFVVVNEILGPIGRNLQQQRRNIAEGQAQIDFWAQFGGNPHHAVWHIGERRRLSPGEEADTSILGSGSYPYVVSIDTASFGRTLPTLITNYRDFLLFLDMAKVLSTIVEDPTMPKFPSAEERRTPRRYYAPVNAPDRDARMRLDVTDIIAPLGERLLGEVDVGMRQSLAALPEAERRHVFRLRQGSETPLFRSARGGQPILSDQQLLGDDPWVRTLGHTVGGGVGSWFFHGHYQGRVLVAPANADAQRAALVSAYVVKKTPDEVLEEVRAGNRPILSRSPPEGDVESFVAGPEPGDSRFGETRYYRHPNWPDVRWTAAIGELHQFWVDADDLEPVALQDVDRYAAGSTATPPH